MSKDPEYVELELDDALKMKEALSSLSAYDTCSMFVCSGHHEKHGWIHLLFPPMGSCLLIKPFASLSRD